MELKVSVWKANLTNGIVLGLLGVVYSLVLYFLDLTVNRGLSLIFLVVQVVLLYFMIKSFRDNYRYGYLTYGQSVGAGVVITLYYAIISAIFGYILLKFIDPGLVNKMLAASEEMMLKRGMPQQAIDAGMAMNKKIMTPAFASIMGLITNMFWGTILSLIISIFTRKEGNPLLDNPANSQAV
jgi:hypothetical protein